jgi:hypothetical protein
MTDRLTYHDMEMLCRQRAVLEGSNSAKWVVQAERWRELAHQEITSRFQGLARTPKIKRPWLPTSKLS